MARIVLRDVFLASIFVAYVEPKLFFTFARENYPVEPLLLAKALSDTWTLLCKGYHCSLQVLSVQPGNHNQSVPHFTGGVTIW